MRRPTASSAISKIEKAGALLVFPVKGKPQLPSLWNAFYPNIEMDWDWSEDGDDRVASLWHLRAELSDSREVIYSKWFTNRASFLSTDLFTALLSLVSTRELISLKLSPDAERILKTLDDDSPLPTKALKIESDLVGQQYSSRFEKGMRELWRRFLIVGYGEVEEGGFPSLAVGSSRLLFEEIWDNSKAMTEGKRDKIIEKYLYPIKEFYSAYLKIKEIWE